MWGERNASIIAAAVAAAVSAYTPADPPKVEHNSSKTIQLKVPICCEGCVEKLHRKLKSVKGVLSVSCDVERQKVTVTGTDICKEETVLKKVRKVKRRSELWKG